MAAKAKPRKKFNYVGAPAVFALELAVAQVWQAFGGFGCYLVGSCLERRDWRDVDVRMILSDEEFAQLFPNAGQHWEHDARYDGRDIGAPLQEDRASCGFPMSAADACKYSAFWAAQRRRVTRKRNEKVADFGCKCSVTAEKSGPMMFLKAHSTFIRAESRAIRDRMHQSYSFAQMGTDVRSCSAQLSWIAPRRMDCASGDGTGTRSVPPSRHRSTASPRRMASLRAAADGTDLLPTGI